MRPRRTRKNEDIRARLIRVISDDGEQLGVLSPSEALDIAYERGLDLVEVSPESDPPVCKIMDWGKYKYEMDKKKREAARSQGSTGLKEIRFRPKIEEHDFAFKARHARKFILAGNKLKVIVRFRGREMIHQDLGRAILERLAEELSDISAIEHFPKMEGRLMTMIISPKSEGKKAK